MLSGCVVYNIPSSKVESTFAPFERRQSRRTESGGLDSVVRSRLEPARDQRQQHLHALDPLVPLQEEVQASQETILHSLGHLRKQCLEGTTTLQLKFIQHLES
jgi:hypothetical protein